MNNYILAVAQYGNVSKAADALGISQPALSAHIKKIEDQLDIVIFDRTVKPMAITDAGKLYIEYINRKNNNSDYNKNAEHALAHVGEIFHKSHGVECHVTHLLFSFRLHKEVEDKTACDNRSNLTRYVNTD